MFIVFDLDGTLADDTHRQHHIIGEPRDWDAYFAACGGDALVQPVATLFRALRVHAFGKHRVEIWTGRSEKYRRETDAWLTEQQLWYDALRMRPDGDFRSDTTVKGEWLAACGDARPDIIFDDRTKSVAFWREQGITCLQVAQHDY